MFATLPQITRETDFETPAILKALAEANRYLGELKGVSASIPNEHILISTLNLQESQDSSAIENIITTQDSLYKFRLHPTDKNSSAKEVHNYAEALATGFALVKQHGIISMNTIVAIQQTITGNDAGLRERTGTALVNERTGEAVYVPPEPSQVRPLLNDLEMFINNPSVSRLDPLIKMTLIHHQFESIHPFYDGNGRTGRILNILYLVQHQLLNAPVLYLSRYINHTREEYYHLLQVTRDDREQWEKWVVYMLEGISLSAQSTIALIQKIKQLLQEQKQHIRSQFPKMYSQDLLNNLFKNPYTKIQFLMQDLDVSRPTATRYLNTLADIGILTKARWGRESYYLNARLIDLLFNIPVIRRGNTDDDREGRGEGGDE